MPYVRGRRAPHYRTSRVFDLTDGAKADISVLDARRSLLHGSPRIDRNSRKLASRCVSTFGTLSKSIRLRNANASVATI